MLGAAALSAQQQVPPANVTTDQSSPTLLVQTNLDCTFTVDDGETQVLKAGEIKRLPISLGEHLFTATSIDRKDQWRVVVNADKPLQKVVLIDLQKTRVDRENAERSVSPSEQGVGGKVAANQGGQGIDTGVGGTTEASKRRAELTDQRVVLQKQIQAEQLAVQVYEAQARQFRASGSTATTGVIGALANGAVAADAENTAASHRATVARLQNQILEITRLLEGSDADLNRIQLPLSGPTVPPGTFRIGHLHWFNFCSGQLTVLPDHIQWEEAESEGRNLKHNFAVDCSHIDFASGGGNDGYTPPRFWIRLRGGIHAGEPIFQLEGPTFGSIADALEKACPSLARTVAKDGEITLRPQDTRQKSSKKE
jgi:hypothetical protein